ncbi:MAG: PqiC family protein [Desulfobulbaceae bacterium]|nr:PqiC family protein [Desulfobulbaceae bacterium]
MTRTPSQTFHFCLGLLLAVLNAGCSATSQPVNYYNLAPVEAVQHRANNKPVRQPLAIGIGPIQFPDALSRAQIAARIDQEHLTFSDSHRWSGSLADDFANVLLEDIAILLPEQTAFALFPWGSYFQPTHRLVLTVSRFDGSLANEVLLTARWTITNSSGKEAILSRKSTIKVKVTGHTYPELVSSQSQAVADLATEIANALTDTSKD